MMTDFNQLLAHGDGAVLGVGRVVGLFVWLGLTRTDSTRLGVWDLVVWSLNGRRENFGSNFSNGPT